VNPYLDDDMVALGDQVRRFAADRIATRHAFSIAD
jgi:hypothetical protein